MSGAVKVPDPVKDRLDREAEERDITRGQIIEGWMQDSDMLAELLHSWDIDDIQELRANG